MMEVDEEMKKVLSKVYEEDCKKLGKLLFKKFKDVQEIRGYKIVIREWKEESQLC